MYSNCIAEGNSGVGFNSSAAIPCAELHYCASYNNSSDYGTGITNAIGFVSQTAGSSFTDAPNGDFSLNNTAGRGALLATGFPGAVVNGTTTGYKDIGAIQYAHRQPAAASRFLCLTSVKKE